MNPALPLCAGLLAASQLPAATQEEIWKVYRAGDATKAAQLGVEAIHAKPDDIDLRQVTGRALVASHQYSAALPHLERVVRLDTGRTWQSAWALAYAGIAHYALGDPAKSQAALEESLRLRATRNVEAFARQTRTLLGFGATYTNWSRLETAHFCFHFSPDLAPGVTNRFADLREAAFEKINAFFGASLPKKIDFFVWRRSEDAEQAGLPRLGFARPDLCIVHSTYKQTVGHEMTHVISGQGIPPGKKTALINEGLAVYFDQTRRDRLASARQAMREAKLESVSLAELWLNLRTKQDNVTYPVAGAFIERLRNRGGDDKLKQLARDETREAARRLYGDDLEKWIKEFELELLKP